MFLGRWARWLFVIAALYVVVGSVALCFSVEWLARSVGPSAGCLTAVGAIAMAINNHNERKTNGRYRKALEAHRAGAGGSSGDGAGARARGGAVGTGAGMTGPFGGGIYRDEMLRKLLAGSSVPSPIRYVEQKPAPRPAGEFDGHRAEFAAGVVTGTRSFAVDKLGRLLGVAYATVWRPGENEARCMYRDDMHSFLYGSGEVLRESNRAPHPMTECGHGFYGYYEGSNDYYKPGMVMGVVEAYGETIIGSRGFRASKARIVALHLPSEISVGTRRLITRNYPDVPTFDSFDAMVAEFPPDDAGNGINPDTDPDFWTRKA